MTIDYTVNPNRPWPIISNKVRSTYKIIAEIDFLDFDQHPDLMLEHLESVKQDDFQPNEKIIVYHYDTDYYLEKTGFALYNFLSCLKFLDISPSVILFFTNHHGIEQEIKNFYSTYYSNFDYQLDSMKIFESNRTLIQAIPNPVTVDQNIEKIRYPFSCLFGSKRSHRVLFLSALKFKNLLSQGLCSWNFTSYRHAPLDKKQSRSIDVNKKHPTFLTTIPFTRTNENWATNQQLSMYYNSYGQLYDVPYRHPDITNETGSGSRFDQLSIQQSLLYISTETVFNYPYPYLTEKTFRAIIYKRPFVILGAPYSLKFLQSIGFKTFNDFWNEDYDSIDDPSTRMLAVVDIVEKICSMSIAQQQELCYNMTQTLDYNFKHYVTNYSNTDLLNQLAKI